MPVPNYGHLARDAMDKLHQAMRERGVMTTMMYDFGVPAVIEAIEDAYNAGYADGVDYGNRRNDYLPPGPWPDQKIIDHIRAESPRK
jgi:hypothetical protein